MLHLISINFIRCENDLLASYDCIHIVIIFVNSALIKLTKKTYFKSLSNVKTVKKVT